MEHPMLDYEALCKFIFDEGVIPGLYITTI